MRNNPDQLERPREAAAKTEPLRTGPLTSVGDEVAAGRWRAHGIMGAPFRKQVTKSPITLSELPRPADEFQAIVAREQKYAGTDGASRLAQSDNRGQPKRRSRKRRGLLDWPVSANR